MPKIVENIKKIVSQKGVNVIDIKRDCYAIASINGEDAEITMYGQVVRKRPKSFWSGKEIEGNFIVADEFIADLKDLKNVKKITVRMDSVGGDVYASLPIYNRMKELKAEITVIIDGVAMSAASFIMCAADKIKTNSASLIMIHKASTLFWFEWLNADELRDTAEFLDKVDEIIVGAYVRKTGMERDDLLKMMSAETYMTGDEAVERGFADEIVEDGKKLSIAASADKRTLFVNGNAMFLPEGFMFENMPGNIPTVEPEADTSATEEINQNQSAQSDERKVGNTMAKNLEELKAENPELAAQLIAEAQSAASAELSNEASTAIADERKRLQEIDEISNLFDDATVQDAKYGENSCTAQEMAHRAAVKAAKEGKSFMKEMGDDSAASGANDVAATSGGNAADQAGEKTGDELQAEANALVAQTIGKKKEG
jgi:ATP-dependent protease ClpP protease subunit